MKDLFEELCKGCNAKALYDEEYCDACNLKDDIAEHDAKVRADSVKEFAEWLSNTEYVASQGHFILPLRGYFTIDEVVAEWEKEQKE